MISPLTPQKHDPQSPLSRIRAQQPAFGRAHDSVRLSGDDTGASDKPSFKERLSAARKDAFNPHQMFGDALWGTLFTAIMFIPLHVFTAPIIPCMMATNAAFRGIRAFARGIPVYNAKT